MKVYTSSIDRQVQLPMYMHSIAIPEGGPIQTTGIAVIPRNLTDAYHMHNSITGDFLSAVRMCTLKLEVDMIAIAVVL